MTKNQKARKRANRSLKRKAEHQQRMEEQMAQIHSEAVKEELTMKNKYGKSDPTAYYAIRNLDRPAWQHEYGF